MRDSSSLTELLGAATNSWSAVQKILQFDHSGEVPRGNQSVVDSAGALSVIDASPPGVPGLAFVSWESEQPNAGAGGSPADDYARPAINQPIRSDQAKG